MATKKKTPAKKNGSGLSGKTEGVTKLTKAELKKAAGGFNLFDLSAAVCDTGASCTGSTINTCRTCPPPDL